MITGIETKEVWTDENDYFVNVLQLYNGQYCKAGLDIVYGITPGTKYVTTPMETPKETPIETPKETPKETPSS